MVRRAMFLLITSLICAGPAFAAETGEIPPPPWLMTNTRGIEVGYALDEAAVRKLLPKGVEPVQDMTGGFEMYLSPAGYGISPYTAFLFFVDVEGIDMPDGRKGRWILQGFYGSEQVAAAIRKHYGWPVRAGTVKMQQNGREITWSGSHNGQDYLVVKVRTQKPECEEHSVLDYWSGKSEAGVILINPIPNTLCLRDVELVAVDVRAPGAEPISALKPGGKTIAYAVEWVNSDWSFTQPLTKR